MGELAAVGDGAVEVVGAEVEGGLGGGFAEHDTVSYTHLTLPTSDLV